jgi:hypothetical protein
MNELIWPMIGVMGVIIVGLIGGGLWLMRADRAKKARPTEPWLGGQPMPLSLPGQRPKPRQPVSAVGAGCQLPFGLAWTAFSLLFLILPIGMFYSEWQTYTLLRDSGVTVEGVITGRRIDEDSEGDTYYVTYKYIAPLPQGDRQQFSREESVGSSLYETLKPETRATVRYAPAQPEVARLEQEFGSPSLFIFCMSGMGGLFTLIGLVLIGSSGHAIYTSRQLAWQGQVAQGFITDRWTDTDSDGDKTYIVAYQFSALGWPPVTVAEYNHSAYDKFLPGDSVRVRYLPNKPQTCRLEV